MLLAVLESKSAAETLADQEVNGEILRAPLFQTPSILSKPFAQAK